MSFLLHLINLNLKVCVKLNTFLKPSHNKNRFSQDLIKLQCKPLNVLLIFAALFNSSVFANQNTFTQTELDWIQLNSTVKVAVSSDYAPISFLTNKQIYTGISADYLTLIEKQIKQINPKFRFSAVIPSAAQRADNNPINKHVDMVVDFVQTPERLRYWRFTKPYLSMPLHLIAREGSTITTDLQQFKGKKLAVVGFYAAVELLAKNNPGLQLKLVDSNQEGLSKVAFGEAEGFVSDLPVASYWANKAGLVGLKVVGTLPYLYEISFATNKNKEILHGILEKSLAQISPNTRQQIQDRWYKGPFVIKPFFKDVRNWLMLAGLLSFALLAWWLKNKISSLNNRLRKQQQALALITQNQVDDTQTLIDIFKHYSKISANTLNVERVGVWMFNLAFNQLECVCLYLKSTDTFVKTAPFDLLDLPIYFDSLTLNRVIAIEDVNHSLTTSEFSYDYLQGNKIGALLDSTIFLDGKTIGVVCHEHVGSTRKWTIDEQSFAGSIADLSRTALENIKRMDAEIALKKYSDELSDKVLERTQALAESEKCYRFVVENAPIPIIVLDQNALIIEANPEAQLAAGYPLNKLINQNFINLLVAKEHKRLAYSAVKDITNHKQFRGVELSLQNAQGVKHQYICSMSVEMQTADGKMQMVAIAQDISKQKALQATLEEASEKAQSTDRLKSMFIASMSHELRTPLNSIIGFLGVVLHGMSGEINTTQKDQLSRAYHSARHLSSLISDVIDVSKIEAGYLEKYVETFELKPLFDEIEYSVKHILEGKPVVIVFNYQDNITLTTDRKRLFQVILNVVSNAIKYSLKGKVEIDASVMDGWLTISVSDSGIGIKQADLAKLFLPFERIDSPLKIKTLGTGLGLYLTNQILMQLLKGNITVKSEINVGSKFEIKLPIDVTLNQINTSNHAGLI